MEYLFELKLKLHHHICSITSYWLNITIYTELTGRETITRFSFGNYHYCDALKRAKRALRSRKFDKHARKYGRTYRDFIFILCQKSRSKPHLWLVNVTSMYAVIGQYVHVHIFCQKVRGSRIRKSFTDWSISFDYLYHDNFARNIINI